MRALCLRWCRSWDDAWLADCACVEVALLCGAACWAEAWGIEPISAEADISKRNLAKRFTAILLSEIPAVLLNHRSARKSPEFGTLGCQESTGRNRLTRRNSLSIAVNFEGSGKSTMRVGLAAELHALEPLDSFALAGDNLCLPDQGDGHQAHGNNAKHQDEDDFRLMDGKGEGTPKPRHG